MKKTNLIFIILLLTMILLSFNAFALIETPIVEHTFDGENLEDFWFKTFTLPVQVNGSLTSLSSSNPVLYRPFNSGSNLNLYEGLSVYYNLSKPVNISKNGKIGRIYFKNALGQDEKGVIMTLFHGNLLQLRCSSSDSLPEDVTTDIYFNFNTSNIFKINLNYSEGIFKFDFNGDSYSVGHISGACDFNYEAGDYISMVELGAARYNYIHDYSLNGVNSEPFTPPTYEKIIFEDNFDNNNLSSEGWLDNGNCSESNSYVSSSNADCNAYQTINTEQIDTSKPINYNFKVNVFNKNNNHIIIGKNSLNYLEFELDLHSNELELKKLGTCSDVIQGYIPFVWNINSNDSLDFVHSIENNSLSLSINGVFRYLITDNDCLNEPLDYINVFSKIDGAKFDYIKIYQDIIMECYDGIDNDNDGYIDFEDLDCVNNPNGFENIVQLTECNDGIDNDNDGLIDYPDDPSCTSPLDKSELPMQNTLCRISDCLVEDKCIFLHDETCVEDIIAHGFEINPEWLEGFIYPEQYNSFGVFALNSMLQYQIITDSGTETAEFMEIRNTFENVADYSYVNSRIEFFFDVQNVVANPQEQERVDYILYNGAYDNQNKILHLALFLSTHPQINSDVIIDIFEVNSEGGFNQIGSARTNQDYLFNRFELSLEMDTARQKYNVLWRGSDGAGATNELDYLIYTYKFPDRFSLISYGDPIGYSSNYNAEVGMYLKELEISGKGEFEITICNEWQKPYYLKEDFNGRLSECGWSSNKDYYFESVLYITKDVELYELAKDFSPLRMEESSFYSTEFVLSPIDFEDNFGYVLVETFSSNKEKNFALFFSKSETNELEIGYFSDGNFNVVATYPMENSIKVEVIFDFRKKTWDLVIDDNYVYENLKIANTKQNPSDISRIKIFSYKSEFKLDNLYIYASSSEGQIVGSDFGNFFETTDPYPEWAGDVFCGYFQSKDIPKQYCSKDSDCETKKCSPTGQCLRFDYNYCDENSMKRDGTCIAIALGECGLEKATDGILNNFMLFLGFMVLLIILTYFIIMTRGK